MLYDFRSKKVHFAKTKHRKKIIFIFCYSFNILLLSKNQIPYLFDCKRGLTQFFFSFSAYPKCTLTPMLSKITKRFAYCIGLKPLWFLRLYTLQYNNTLVKKQWFSTRDREPRQGGLPFFCGRESF